MIVCLCRGVCDRRVAAAIAEGASDVDELGAACGAGTDCGGCRGHLAGMLSGGERGALAPSGETARHPSPPLAG